MRRKRNLRIFQTTNCGEIKDEKTSTLFRRIIFGANNITELNNLIYTGAKLVDEKVVFPLKNKIKMAKPRLEIRLET